MTTPEQREAIETAAAYEMDPAEVPDGFVRYSQVVDEDLAPQGYVAGYALAARSLFPVMDLDRSLLIETYCPVCGEEMQYRPWSKSDGYRAFCVCITCDVAAEF